MKIVNFFIKKVLPLSLILFFSIFILFLLFPKKLTKEKIENKVTQLEAALPARQLIQMAFVPQAPEKNWDQPWQDACEEAALLTVDYFYKNQNPDINQIKNDLQSMIDFETGQGWKKDVNIDQMGQIGSKYLNYKSQIINDPSIDQIKNFISQNIPVIAPANGKILYEENRFFNDNGPYYHNIVILGYDDTKKQFTVHDVGTRHGKNFRYSYSLLMESIHDFPITGNKEDIQTGEKKVLILLK